MQTTANPTARSTSSRIMSLASACWPPPDPILIPPPTPQPPFVPVRPLLCAAMPPIHCAIVSPRRWKHHHCVPTPQRAGRTGIGTDQGPFQSFSHFRRSCSAFLSQITWRTKCSTTSPSTATATRSKKRRYRLTSFLREWSSGSITISPISLGTRSICLVRSLQLAGLLIELHLKGRQILPMPRPR